MQRAKPGAGLRCCRAHGQAAVDCVLQVGFQAVSASNGKKWYAQERCRERWHHRCTPAIRCAAASEPAFGAPRPYGTGAPHPLPEPHTEANPPSVSAKPRTRPTLPCRLPWPPDPGTPPRQGARAPRQPDLSWCTHRANPPAPLPVHRQRININVMPMPKPSRRRRTVWGRALPRGHRAQEPRGASIRPSGCLRPPPALPQPPRTRTAWHAATMLPLRPYAAAHAKKQHLHLRVRTWDPGPLRRSERIHKICKDLGDRDRSTRSGRCRRRRAPGARRSGRPCLGPRRAPGGWGGWRTR